MTQFKDKAGKNKENVSVGLMVYPNLMAADILAYLATHVPVGDDQKQHLELSRDIAQKFNNDFGVDFFPLPEPLIYGNATRVMSLRDGTKKMSKSDPSDFSRILLTDEDDIIVSKIKKAKSDSELIPSSLDDLEAKPECLNLINILSASLNQEASKTLGQSAKSFLRVEYSFPAYCPKVLEASWFNEADKIFMRFKHSGLASRSSNELGINSESDFAFLILETIISSSSVNKILEKSEGSDLDIFLVPSRKLITRVAFPYMRGSGKGKKSTPKSLLNF
jgi:hypothetical protein